MTEASSDDGLGTSERVFRRLRHAIMAGEVQPGTRLVELTLARRYGVSRTPVREALKRLVYVGLLQTDQLGSVVVRTPDADELDETYQLREVLDGFAARLAAERVTASELARLRVINGAMREGIKARRTEVIVNANIAFHDLIYRIAGNRTLERHAMELRDFVRRFASDAFAHPSRVDAVLRDHERLLEALKRRDPAAAEHASTEHLRKARAYLSEQHLRRAVGVAVAAPG